MLGHEGGTTTVLYCISTTSDWMHGTSLATENGRSDLKWACLDTSMERHPESATWRLASTTGMQSQAVAFGQWSERPRRVGCRPRQMTKVAIGCHLRLSGR